ncbi:MAG: DUF2953 domain-containing protein [Lachnospiraceae bacterium]|nr:DUF2953 domain-containing protein [Lachnospiraceae bacterium]
MILTILKVAGVLLLALVLLVLALLLAILFAPIRYRVSAAFTDVRKHGEVKISWLLHLISVDAFVGLPPSVQEKTSGERSSESGSDPDDEKNPLSGLSNLRTGVQIRILGIDPMAVRAFFQKRKQKKAEKRHAGEKQTGRRRTKTRQAKQGGQREQDSRAGKSGRTKNTVQGEPVKDVEQTEEVRQTEQANRMEKTESPAPEERIEREAAPLRERKEKEKQEIPEKQGKQNFGKIHSILYKLRGLCDKIKQIPNAVRRLAQKGKKLLQKPEQMKRKMNRFLRKIEKYQARKVLLDVWAQVKRLLRHFRVRKGSGYLRFGTGDPAFTGELTGVLYLLLPASCGELDLEPQFTDTTLEMDLTIRGHIRLIHLIHFAWWAFFNKKLRRLIHAFRR